MSAEQNNRVPEMTDTPELRSEGLGSVASLKVDDWNPWLLPSAPDLKSGFHPAD
jgi:hypothetical protein